MGCLEGVPLHSIPFLPPPFTFLLFTPLHLPSIPFPLYNLTREHSVSLSIPFFKSWSRLTHSRVPTKIFFNWINLVRWCSVMVVERLERVLRICVGWKIEAWRRKRRWSGHGRVQMFLFFHIVNGCSCQEISVGFFIGYNYYRRRPVSSYRW